MSDPERKNDDDNDAVLIAAACCLMMAGSRFGQNDYIGQSHFLHWHYFLDTAAMGMFFYVIIHGARKWLHR